jgi:hypothetical protein
MPKMSKPRLTADRLIVGGFKEVGCWELNSARDLAHSIDLPKQGGVYAFVIDGVAQYVGLASKSLHQRLGFYRKPGVSQRTNIRLNEVIRGHLRKGTIVQIFTAQPPDHEWNGFKVKGAEGLEAGLIADFDLPWNVRGAVRAVVPDSKRSNAPRQSGVAARIVELVRKRPGMTELEIAKAIYGPLAVQQQVNQHCRVLVRDGALQRLGAGGALDPFVYRAGN